VARLALSTLGFQREPPCAFGRDAFHPRPKHFGRKMGTRCNAPLRDAAALWLKAQILRRWLPMNPRCSGVSEERRHSNTRQYAALYRVAATVHGPNALPFSEVEAFREPPSAPGRDAFHPRPKLFLSSFP
jgi:hypothetical protein